MLAEIRGHIADLRRRLRLLRGRARRDRLHRFPRSAGANSLARMLIGARELEHRIVGERRQGQRPERRQVPSPKRGRADDRRPLAASRANPDPLPRRFVMRIDVRSPLRVAFRRPRPRNGLPADARSASATGTSCSTASPVTCGPRFDTAAPYWERFLRTADIFQRPSQIEPACRKSGFAFTLSRRRGSPRAVCRSRYRRRRD